jgi:hypothetical protein
MHLIRDLLEPGSRLLARRLDQLCATLESLRERLHATLANVLGDCIGGFARDGALGVIDHIAQGLPDPSQTPYAPSPIQRDDGDPDAEEERRVWQEEQTETNGREEIPGAPRQPERLPTALSAGLQAASYCLRRGSGAHRTLTSVAVGLFATGFAFLGGPLALALLDLAASATQYRSLPLSMDTGAAAAGRFHSSNPNTPLRP